MTVKTNAADQARKQQLEYALAKQLNNVESLSTTYGDFEVDHEMREAIATALWPIIRERIEQLETLLVTIAGEDYQIVDIGMRMLTPRELYRAQGFPDWYSFDCLNKTQAVAKCGNSVSPVVAQALVEANLVEKKGSKRRAA